MQQRSSHGRHLIRIRLMPKISLVAPSTALSADAVVIGVVQGEQGPELAPGADAVQAALGDASLVGRVDRGRRPGPARRGHEDPDARAGEVPARCGGRRRARGRGRVGAARQSVRPCAASGTSAACTSRSTRRSVRSPKARHWARTSSPSTSRLPRRRGCGRSRCPRRVTRRRATSSSERSRSPTRSRSCATS